MGTTPENGSGIIGWLRLSSKIWSTHTPNLLYEKERAFKNGGHGIPSRWEDVSQSASSAKGASRTAAGSKENQP